MNGKKINYQLLLRRICLIVLDIFLIIISSAMALATRFEFDFGQIPEEFISVIRDYGVLMILVTLLCFAVFRIYSSLWEYAGQEETFKIVTSIRGNSLTGYISTESPVGKAIFGHRVGETVQVKVNDNYSYDVEIREIVNSTDDEEDTIRGF